MENKQIPASEHHVKMNAWIDYMSQPPFTKKVLTEQAKVVMQQVLEAIELGNSCVATKRADALSLENLVGVVEPKSSDLDAITPFVYDQDQLFLYRYWQLEQRVATQIARIQTQTVARVELTDQHLSLLNDPQQLNALNMVASEALNIITGGPGTGKTYTLAHIIAVLNQALPNLRIAMAAPTGKAAQRMKEALQNALHSEALADFNLESLKQLQPVTLHRLLGLGTKAQARFNLKQPLPYDVIVVDEASMLDLNLSAMLLEAVPKHARLILLGDADQLASVDVGTVLADLQAVQALEQNRVNLIKTRRFASGAKIGAMAQFIQAQHQAADVLSQFEQEIVTASHLEEIPLDEIQIDHVQLQYLPVASELKNNLDQYYDQLMYGYQSYVMALKSNLQNGSFDAFVAEAVRRFDDYRVLTSIRHGYLGLELLNQNIEQRMLDALGVSKQGDWYVGRPVMMTYNDYQLGLSNGDIGICFKPERDGHAQFEVYFPSLEKWVLAARLPKSIETAFALTIHKSQGSEFSHTAVVLDHGAKNLLSKELIYTAITRAKKVVSLLVDCEAFTQSLCVKTTRSSGLSIKIVEKCIEQTVKKLPIL